MWSKDLLPSSDYPALDQGYRTHLPCLFDIAVFCMSIYQWVLFPKLLKAMSGWVRWFKKKMKKKTKKKKKKRLDVSIFSRLVYLWFPASVHRLISPCALFIEPRQTLYETQGLQDTSYLLGLPLNMPGFPNYSSSSDLCAIRAIVSRQLLT